MGVTNWETVLDDARREAFRALIRLGGAHRQMGEYSHAMRCFSEAQQLASALGDDALCAEATRWTGNVEYHAGHYRQALRYFDGQDALARNYHVQSVLSALGDHVGCLEQSLAAVAALTRQHPAGVRCGVLSHHVGAQLDNGLLAEAWVSLRCVSSLQENGLGDMPLVYGVVWQTMARALAAFGFRDQAEHYATKELALCEAQSVTAGQVEALVILAAISRDPYRVRMSLLRRAESLLVGFREDPLHFVNVKLSQAEVCLSAARFDDARTALDETDAELHAHARLPQIRRRLLLQARLSIGIGEWDAAQRALDKARLQEKRRFKVARKAPEIPLAYCSLWRGLGDRRRFALSLETAWARYEALTEGLPKRVLAAMATRDDIAELCAWRRQ